MRLSPASILLFAIGGLILSCTKEYSLETDLGTPVAGDGLLIKSVMKDAVSEINFTYEYNASGLPIKNLFSASTTGFSANGSFNATRDAGGKISSTMVILSSNVTTAPDTMHYTLKRNSAGKVAYMLVEFADTANTAGYDSIVYAYNTAGKIAGYVTYLVDYTSRLAVPIQSFELTYTGENVVKSVEYELNGSLTSRTLIETITFFYDDKPAARVVTEDDFIAGLTSSNNMAPAVNNTTKYSREYAQEPDENLITEYNYVYGSNGKPTTAEVTTIRTGQPATKATLSFTYR
jgi:hypothetical protein